MQKIAGLKGVIKTRNWQEVYKEKCTSAENALRVVKSGDRVVLGHAAGEPLPLVDALVARKNELEKIEIVHMVALGKGEYAKPGMESHFRHNALFAGACTRDAINTGRGDYTPCFFSEIPRLFKDNYLPVDVALIQVSPPDKHGYCSYGISVDYTKAAAEAAKVVIAEVNRQMPRTYTSFIHVEEIDHIVETDRPVIELQPTIISEVEKAIGEHVAKLVENGSVLQLGIGGIPDAVLLFLDKKEDLGIHSEMFSDGVVHLVEKGVITCKNYSLDPGRMAATFLMGTRKLYDYVDNNIKVSMLPVDYINDPCTLSQINKLVSINSAIQVDLMGQVCADTMGYKQFSGVGGQVDFVRGASRSPGGKSIIAMPATAKQGQISKIVPVLDEGAAVTTSRNDVHFVVTEFGIADLRGKTVRQRAEELINIAHPDFRKELGVSLKRRSIFLTKSS